MIGPPLEALGPVARPTAEDPAAQLEAYFVRRMFAEMRASSQKGLLSGGFGDKMFTEMLDEALADAIAESGGIGIASSIGDELGGPEPEPVSRTSALEAYKNQTKAQSELKNFGELPIVHKESSQ